MLSNAQRYRFRLTDTTYFQMFSHTRLRISYIFTILFSKLFLCSSGKNTRKFNIYYYCLFQMLIWSIFTIRIVKINVCIIFSLGVFYKFLFVYSIFYKKYKKKYQNVEIVLALLASIVIFIYTVFSVQQRNKNVQRIISIII